MKKLIVTVGLPRSGKSTWAKAKAKEIGCPIVNRDSVRLALHGEHFLAPAEPMVAAITKIMIDALFLCHDVVILDECNITEKRRSEWIKSEKWETEFVYIITSKEECIRRAKSENDDVIIPVIERMWNECDVVAIKEAR